MHQVSPYNVKSWKLEERKHKRFLCDVTARDGEQTAGVFFSVKEKVELARRLDAMGVGQLQYAAVLSSVDAMRAAKAICALDLAADVEIMTYINTANWKDQVKAAIECGADVVHALIPVSPQTRSFYDPLNDDATIDRAVKYIHFAKEQGAKAVNLNMLDCPRSEEPFFDLLVTSCVMAGVDRMRINDTVGTATPDGIYFLVRKAKQIIHTHKANTLIGLHCHNDFGLATANTIAGIRAGADFADVSVNGLGERAGNADLAEVAVALTLLYGVDCGIHDLSGLYELSRYVESISGVVIPSSKPLMGDLVFSDQSDKHNMALSENPYAFQGIKPQVVGNRRRITIGKKTGLYTLSLKLAELGLSLPEDFMDTALAAVQKAARNMRGQPLPDLDCERILLKYGAQKI